MSSILSKSRLLSSLALATSLCATAATLETVPAESPGAMASYRFKLRDPQSLTEPYRHGRYKLMLRGEERMSDGEKVVYGVTDASGHTQLVHTRRPVAEDLWEVSPLVGRGDNTTSFHFVESQTGENLPGKPYLVNVLVGDVHCGYADEQGHTAVVASPSSESIHVHTFSSMAMDECLAMSKETHAARGLPTLRATLEALHAVAKRHPKEPFAGVLAEKARWLPLARGSASDVRRMLARELAKATGDEPNARSDTLNGVGYGLLQRQPPRHVALAVSFIEESLSLDPGNPDKLDSLAFGQHLLGRHAEALKSIDQSLAAFIATCKAEELATRQIAYGHRGSILWALGHRDAAIDHWALARRAGPESTWSIGVESELVNRHVVRRAERTAATDLCQPLPTSSTPTNAARD